MDSQLTALERHARSDPAARERLSRERVRQQGLLPELPEGIEARLPCGTILHGGCVVTLPGGWTFRMGALVTAETLQASRVWWSDILRGHLA